MRPFLSAALLVALLPGLPARGEEVGRIGVDWVGNDIIVEAIQDPKIGGVTCHLAYFERSLLDRLSQGNWFEDPSNSAIECSRTGPIDIGAIRVGRGGETVFSEGRSLIFKSLRVRRIYDAENRVLVYVAHANELAEGSAKMAISTVGLSEAEAATAPAE
ncbi:CreA family protein [Paracoccus siganidrum]|uniref:CREA protein n=1 Tax=Paracoccus siganidrum TaxID=1276757 RepID=A0A419A5W7_9RHOB|nr:CreA family protein [Paracoccus siganidrum]RJL12570.1 CREA protein [Paracoccus siganidrum]RMC37184.1 CREA protein [Paracoccus siganidrum]